MLLLRLLLLLLLLLWLGPSSALGRAHLRVVTALGRQCRLGGEASWPIIRNPWTERRKTHSKQ